MSTEVEGVLAEVLDRHVLHASMNICWNSAQCGWRPVHNAGSLGDQHRAHVAAEQAKALAESGLIPTVEIARRLGQASTCKVWRAGVLVFDGMDRSAAIFGGPQ